MTLFMGATIAVAGILSGLQVQTFFIFLPMIVEFFLKFRGHFRAENYCSKSENGYLDYHKRVESVTHIFMKHMKVTEKELVFLIWGVEVAICTFVIAIDILV
jgi:UDP-N-acetylmuramyl pentapeptide phosphotransferase/UDP-N-acetylglucosamine-1-phosphate transferase